MDPVLVSRGGRKPVAKGDGNDVQAYHLECEAGREDDYAKTVAWLYSSTRNEPPCDEQMRFIGLSQRYQNTNFLRTQSLLRTKQLWFLASVGTAKSYEIAELDYLSKAIGVTLRTVLMDMKTTDGNQLFWTVDNAWNGDGTVFTFIERNRDEAISRIADLGPYLYHKFGAHIIRKYMTPAAADRARNSKWDAARNCAVSQEEEEYANMIAQIENDYDWLQNPNSSSMIEGLPPNDDSVAAHASAPTRPNNLFNYAPDDDESLGTYGQVTHATPNTHGAGAKVTPDKRRTKSKKKSNSAQPSAGRYEEDLTDDDHTIDTLSSRLTTLENGLNNLIHALNSNTQANAGTSSGQAKSKKHGRKPAGSVKEPAGRL